MWKSTISPGQIGFISVLSFPRRVDCPLLGQTPCGRCGCHPQLSVTFPQAAPLVFPIAWTQAFLIFWMSSLIWLNVSGCSAICFVIFCTAWIAVVWSRPPKTRAMSG